MNTEPHHIPLLRTKLNRPPVPADHVPRTELLKRLDKHIDRPIVLVSAPAGYGKSTLASFWLEQCKKPGAWLSLDESDDDLHPFLTYFIASLQTLFTDAFSETTAILHARDLPPATVLAATLVNEIEQIDQRFIIVLDDIHRIKNKAVYNFLDLILRHPPPSMQLVLVGRRDPLLSISSMRASGVLTELRMRDLRFTVDEASRFLQAAAGHPVEKEITAVLIQKAEGWVTGLRLAVLAMRGQEHLGRKLLELKGTTRYVVDYLISEVLDRQPSGVAQFFLAISILDRFCAPLCDALCEGDAVLAEAGMDGQELIDWLRKNNLFIIPLDIENQWFRYHHLFQQLLQRQLQREANAEEIAVLHGKASQWFENQGLIDEAIRHAMDAGDVLAAGKIIERHRYAPLNDDKWFIVERWLAQIPAETIERSPGLLLAQAWVLNHQFRLTEIPKKLEHLDSIIREGIADDSLIGELNFFNGFLLFWQGQVEAGLVLNRKAQAQIPKEKKYDLIRGDNEIYCAMALQMSGQGEMAIRELNEKIHRHTKQVGMYLTRLVSAPCFVHLLSGDLKQAETAARQLRHVSKKSGLSYADSWSNYIQACCYFHAYDMQKAYHYFSAASRHPHIMHRSQAVNCLAGLAITQQVMGQTDEARATADRLTEFALETNDPNIIAISQSAKARLSLIQGDFDPGMELVCIGSPPLHSSLFFLWLELPHISCCRALIAMGTKNGWVEACKRLAQLLATADAIHNIFHKIDLLVLKGLALYMRSRMQESLKTLEQAVHMAMPGGWVRPFVEPGDPMPDMLSQLKKQNISADFIDKILAAFPTRPPQGVSRSGLAHEGGFLPPRPLIEPLTHRELDVLEQLSKRLQNKEIAERLSISPGTVKVHLSNIYQKLNVTKRREAVEKAAMLKLFTSATK